MKCKASVLFHFSSTFYDKSLAITEDGGDISNTQKVIVTVDCQQIQVHSAYAPNAENSAVAVYY